VKHLFPGRVFCIRIADHRTMQLTSLYAEGRLREGAPEQLVFRRSAIGKTHLREEKLPAGRVRIIDDDVPLLFARTVRSICAPLVASGHLFGLLNVEYPEGLAADLETDNQLLIQLANQVAVGVRNAKLIDELTFVRKYLEELLEHANALIVVTNRDQRVVVFNRQIVKLTGFAREEVLGKELLQFIPEAERERVARVIASSLKGEQVSNFETRVLGRSGREVRVSFSTSAVLATRGDVEGVIAIGQDLTQIKELERRVIQAEKMSTVGQLAASVVHEINNPMTAVTAYADSLLQHAMVRPEPDPGEQEKLRKILENSARILRFSRDLGSYARPAQDKAEPVELPKVLDMAVGFCDHTLVQHGVEVIRDYGSVPVIPAVKGNLVQVFVNLITNACHALQPGGEVRLSTRLEGDEVVVRVADNGCGIPAENLDRVFEPFFTTKPDGKGTGLGLSIVQGIVEKHGGRIDVKTDVGNGTVFSIRLPTKSA
jgi:PAS domain S-box-containing protein